MGKILITRKKTTKMTNQKLAVIYANDENIWDNNKKIFQHIKRTVDEYSFSMPLAEAEIILKSINEQRKEEGVEEAYINELPNIIS